MNNQEYWQNRFEKHGKNYVANVCLNNYDNQNLLIRELIKPYLSHYNRTLDFGCGIGRFQDFLYEYSDEVCAVDVVPEVLETVSASFPTKVVRYRLPECKYPVDFPYNEDEISQELDCCPVDFPDNHFDLIWSITALQHIVHENLFLHTCNEINRLANKDATIILVENIHDKAGHVKPRTKDEYINAIGMEEVVSQKLNIDKAESHWLIVGKFNA